MKKSHVSTGREARFISVEQRRLENLNAKVSRLGMTRNLIEDIHAMNLQQIQRSKLYTRNEKIRKAIEQSQISS
jgi:hypothetical protein